MYRKEIPFFLHHFAIFGFEFLKIPTEFHKLNGLGWVGIYMVYSLRQKCIKGQNTFDIFLTSNSATILLLDRICSYPNLLSFLQI